MRPSIVGGRPQRDGRPTVLVARVWDPPASAGQARAAAHELAAAGWAAVWLRAGTSAEPAGDACRRAGLVVLVDGTPEAAAAVWAESPEAALAALFAGGPLLAGEPEAVAAAAALVALCDDAGALAPTDLGDGWRGLVGDGELLAWHPEGGRLTLPAGAAVHLIDPVTGEVLGVLTPDSREPVTVAGEDGPLAIYQGPNRHRPSDEVTRPEA